MVGYGLEQVVGELHCNLTLRLTIYNTKSKENQMTIYMLGGLAINEVEVTEEEGASLIAEGKAFATYDDAYWEARLLDL